jgi:hypothetical protein
MVCAPNDPLFMPIRLAMAGACNMAAFASTPGTVAKTSSASWSPTATETGIKTAVSLQPIVHHFAVNGAFMSYNGGVFNDL